MSSMKGFKGKALAWLLALTMLFATPSFAFASSGGNSGDSVSVSKSAEWVSGTSAKDQGIAKVQLKVNCTDQQIVKQKSTRIVLVLDRSGSMNDNGKISDLKNAAKSFVDDVLAIDNADVKVAVVSYAENAKTEAGFSDTASSLKQKINGIDAGGGTNIQAGINSARTLMSSVKDDTGQTPDNRFIIVLSDGEPTYSYKASHGRASTDADMTSYNYDNTKFSSVLTDFNYRSNIGYGYSYDLTSQGGWGDWGQDYWADGRHITENGTATVSEALFAKQAGYTMYSIGFDIGGSSNAENVMKSIADKGNYYQTSGNLQGIFDSISAEIENVAAGTGAVVTDPVGYGTVAGKEYKFKAITGDSSYPVTVTAPSGVNGKKAEYDSATDTYKWTLSDGDLAAGEYTLTYYVKLNIDDLTGNVGKDLTKVATNNGAQLKYTDQNGTEQTRDFEDPELDITHYSVQYYYSYDNGETYVQDTSLTSNAAAIVGCSDKTVTQAMIDHGAKSGCDFQSSLTRYGNNSSSNKLTIVQNDSQNIIKLYYKKYYAAGTASLSAHKTYDAGLSGNDFSFRIQAADSSGSALTGSDAWSETVKNAADGSVDFSAISYNQDDAGHTFYYRITEAAGSNTNINYSGDVYTAAVKVTDPDKDGLLKTEVTYYKGAGTGGTVLNGGAVPEFTNSFTGTAVFNFKATKNLVGKALKDGDFTFKAYEKDGSGNIGSSAVATGTSKADGTIDFSDITYHIGDVGTHTYVIKEVVPADPMTGVTYDTSGKTVKVKVEYKDGQLTATQVNDSVKQITDFVKGGTGGLTHYETADGSTFALVKQATYAIVWTQNALSGLEQTSLETQIKALDPSTAGDTFYFINGTGITFTKGTYGLLDKNSIGNYTFSVSGGKIILNCNGKISHFDYGTYDCSSEVQFTNVFTPTAAEVTLGATKKLTGRTLKTGDVFTFGLYEGTDTTADPIDTVSTTAISGNTQTVSFGKMTYNEPGTYTYTIKEIKPATGALGGVTYSDKTYKVTVTVTKDSSGNLQASTVMDGKTFDAKDALFENVYNTEGTGQISLSKVMTGRTLKADEFSFDLTEVDASGNPVANGYKATVKNDADGHITFSSIPYTAAGTYYYEIKEKIPADADKEGGVTYDTSVVKVSMNVHDDGNGNLIAVPTYPSDTTFDNSYDASGSINLEATKTLSGRDLTADEFSFEVVDSSDNVVAKGKNDASGNVKFSDIKYTLADLDGASSKDFTYTVKEKIPADTSKEGGVTYDTKTYQVTVTVTDNGDGTLQVTADKSASDMTFDNSYDASGSINLEATKTLSGRDIAVDEFSFEVVDSSDNVVATGKNDASGNIKFSDIKYTLADLDGASSKDFTYTVKEKIPADADKEAGMTYDTRTYTVTVTVKDNGDGTLKVTADKSASDMTFSNSFEDPGTIQVTKNTFVDGEGQAVNMTFYAALFNANNERVSDVKAIEMNGNKSSTVTFDKVKLDATYYVYETDQDGNIITDPTAQGVEGWANITYDNQVITLTPNNLEGSAAINNYFTSQEEYDYGSVQVTKEVTVNGEGTPSKATFYTALFSDEACTNRITEVKALNMNGEKSTTVEFSTDKDGNYLPVGTKYYVAETDKDGNAITDPETELGCTIEQDTKSVTITPDNMTPTAKITNKFTGGEDYYYKDGTTATKTSATTSTQTGDDSNVGLWLLMALIGVAGAITPAAMRRREEKDKE